MKEQEQDFEWYPTTFDMVKAIYDSLDTNGINHENIHSILDIGCGNGCFFDKLDSFIPEEVKTTYRNKLHKGYIKYGIEKSLTLLDNMSDDIVLLGTDFYTQTLIDKKVDVIFCNPPYSDYETWAYNIILTGNCKAIYLVLPKRWNNSEKIKEALNKRCFVAEVLLTDDFNHAERQARATINVLYIHAEKTSYNNYRYDKEVKSAFDIWFDDTFKINADKKESYISKDRKKEIKNELVECGDTAEMLVKLYNKDMEQLCNNYKTLETLDSEIFMELNVNIDNLKKSLAKRLQDLKTLYWNMLFEKYDKITIRLSTKGRDIVLKKLADNTVIDFTLENIYQMTLWIIKHSNTLFDSQITDFFYSLCNSDSIQRYKSDKRWNNDTWRYCKQAMTDCDGYKYKKDGKLKNVMLDYRIVVKAFKNFDYSWSQLKMDDSCINFLNDLTVIAGNLGYKLNMTIPNRYDSIEIDKWSNFNVFTIDKKLFCNIKLYKNGNRHIKFDPEFMKKLNVEMARINHWINNKEELKEEMGLNENEINKYWNCNSKFEIENTPLLLGLPQFMD